MWLDQAPPSRNPVARTTLEEAVGSCVLLIWVCQPLGKHAGHTCLLVVLSPLTWMYILYRVLYCSGYLTSVMCCFFLPMAPSRGQTHHTCLRGYVSVSTGATFLAVQQFPRAHHPLLSSSWKVCPRPQVQLSINLRTAALVLFLVRLVHSHYHITPDYV